MGHTFAGLAASPGVGLGRALVLDTPQGPVAVVEPERRAGEADAAVAALAGAAAEIAAVARGLRAGGREAEAEIVETGALMAEDPALAAEVRASVLEQGLPASRAILEAAGRHAAAIAALGDAELALRADDVRSIGRRAARLAAGDGAPAADGLDTVLLADDLGPADVAELSAGIAGVGLTAGGVMAHAAIVARSLGIPMVVGLDERILSEAEGKDLIVDGTDGSVTVAPAREERNRARRDAARRSRAREQAAAAARLPAETEDGRRISVLVNVASAAEVAAGLAAGAEGVGLLRTELAWLDAPEWPPSDAHRNALAPILALLPGRVATVRVLDFGGDKTPPFLHDGRRGIELLLAFPDRLREQLTAILDAGRGTALRVMVPMVESADQVEAVRELIGNAAGVDVGAMIETAVAAAGADEIAAACDFISIGTNDLTHSVLGADRFAPGEAFTHHPDVLRAIEASVSAAAARGIPVEVCGEAASDPLVMPLLLGLGVDELSVGAARVGDVRAWVRRLGYENARALAREALRLEHAFEVAQLMRPCAARLAETGDAAGEGLDGRHGIAALGPQP